MENRRSPPTPGGFALSLKPPLPYNRNARRRSKLVCAEEASFQRHSHFSSFTPQPYRSIPINHFRKPLLRSNM